MLVVELADFGKLTRHMEDTKRMFEPCVQSAWVHEIREGKLPYPTQPLKNRGGYDICFFAR